MKTLTLSQRVPLAEVDEPRRRLPLVPRPTVRGDCDLCATCQEWRDAGANRRAKPLTCGHSHDQAYSHSRPCVWVSCRHHLYLDVTIRGSCKLNFPDRDVDELASTCSLDVAADGEHTLEEIGDRMAITRERARQLEARALWKGRHAAELDQLAAAPSEAAMQRLLDFLQDDESATQPSDLYEDDPDDAPVVAAAGAGDADDDEQ